MYDVKNRYTDRKTKKENITPVVVMKTKTYRHNADNTTYYKEITVNYFLHNIVIIQEDYCFLLALPQFCHPLSYIPH